MNPMDELLKISHLIPFEPLQDINRRIGDWLAMGGKQDDPYIAQQLRYAKRYVREDNGNV
ncbi:hypothetical protein PBAT_02285 [Paenibacillus antarcticus]|uniref:DUF6877 domain-containing protein n=2 Tax=Paenibacillus antarcticus TaxID=253703 RepID=A0A168R1Y6_9BACL|nr:DUF6877 family protein [Paenibacillus antarcticus]OAB48482.1 hypothetical protein PBAT_02285 [Paenibacillus antarcticus]